MENPEAAEPRWTQIWLMKKSLLQGLIRAEHGCLRKDYVYLNNVRMLKFNIVLGSQGYIYVTMLAKQLAVAKFYIPLHTIIFLHILLVNIPMFWV